MRARESAVKFDNEDVYLSDGNRGSMGFEDTHELLRHNLKRVGKDGYLNLDLR